MRVLTNPVAIRAARKKQLKRIAGLLLRKLQHLLLEFTIVGACITTWVAGVTILYACLTFISNTLWA